MSDRPGGGRPTFDPKDQVHGIESRKRGEWYETTGYVGGRKVSVGIPANEVEGRSSKDAHALMRRSLLGTANQERRS